MYIKDQPSINDYNSGAFPAPREDSFALKTPRGKLLHGWTTKILLATFLNSATMTALPIEVKARPTGPKTSTSQFYEQQKKTFKELDGILDRLEEAYPDKYTAPKMRIAPSFKISNEEREDFMKRLNLTPSIMDAASIKEAMEIYEETTKHLETKKSMEHFLVRGGKFVFFDDLEITKNAAAAYVPQENIIAIDLPLFKKFMKKDQETAIHLNDHEFDHYKLLSQAPDKYKNYFNTFTNASYQKLSMILESHQHGNSAFTSFERGGSHWKKFKKSYPAFSEKIEKDMKKAGLPKGKPLPAHVKDNIVNAGFVYFHIEADQELNRDNKISTMSRGEQYVLFTSRNAAFFENNGTIDITSGEMIKDLGLERKIRIPERILDSLLLPDSSLFLIDPHFKGLDSSKVATAPELTEQERKIITDILASDLAAGTENIAIKAHIQGKMH